MTLGLNPKNSGLKLASGGFSILCSTNRLLADLQPRRRQARYDCHKIGHLYSYQGLKIILFSIQKTV